MVLINQPKRHQLHVFAPFAVKNELATLEKFV